MKTNLTISYYLESSALLAWLLNEPLAGRIASKISKAKHVCISVISLLETRRILTRYSAINQNKEIRIPSIKGSFERYLPQCEVMQLTPEVQRRVGEPFPVEPIRTLDAIHLATATLWAQVFPDLQILTLDQRIMANLEPLGLEPAKF